MYVWWKSIVLIFFVAIPLSFEYSSYIVDEGDVSISPVLKLNEPSPCCITVYAELTDGPGRDQATGKFHYYAVFYLTFVNVCKYILENTTSNDTLTISLNATDSTVAIL